MAYLRALSILSLIFLAACTHTRIAGRNCDLRLLPVEVNAGAEAEEAAIGAPSYRQTFDSLLNVREPEEAAVVPEILVLSGGGKWGAYGAGFLASMPSRANYRVVTGVSTGALQASFALLANQPVPASRAAIYTAGNDLMLDETEPQPGAGRLFIHDLARAYSVSRSETIVNVHGKELTALRQGAAADYAPLRRRLAILLDRDMLERIARETDPNGPNRGLFVGVANMDDGREYAIDLGALARRAVASGADFNLLQSCYIDALIASSSEPLLVPPVFIDGRMYLDGGLRNGVFLQEVLDPQGDPLAEAARPKFQATIILNGDLRIRDNAADPPTGWREKWSLLTVLGRTKDLLVNQIYEFSVRRVQQFGSARGTVRLTTARGFEEHQLGASTCASLQAKQKEMAFPPEFMRCLIDWGANRATQANGGWDVITPTAPVDIH